MIDIERQTERGPLRTKIKLNLEGNQFIFQSKLNYFSC